MQGNTSGVDSMSKTKTKDFLRRFAFVILYGFWSTELNKIGFRTPSPVMSKKTVEQYNKLES